MATIAALDGVRPLTSHHSVFRGYPCPN